MAEENENHSKIASMLAVAAFLSDSRRAPVCPYCGAWGNPIQIAYDDDCVGMKPDAVAGAWTDHAKRWTYSVGGGTHAGQLAGEMPMLQTEPPITHHALHRRYQCCQCTQVFAA